MVNLAYILALVATMFLVAVVAGSRLNYEGYWLNNRRTANLFLVATIVATQVGAGTTLGIAASTAQSGTGYGVVAVVTTVLGFLLIPLCAPHLSRMAQQSGEFTLTGLLRWRYGKRTGIAGSLIVCGGYLGLLAAQLVAGAVLLTQIAPLGWVPAVLISGAAVMLYSSFAGLRGDIVTDGILFLFMIFLFALTVGVVVQVVEASPSVIDRLPASTLSPVEFGGYEYLVGGTLGGVLIPLLSLEMWLRVFAASSVADARRAFRWSALLVAPFYFVAIVVGALSVPVLGQESPGQTVYLDFLREFVPTGLLVVVNVGLVATIISTSNTLVLVVGAVVHRDIIRRNTQSVAASRITVLFVGLAASASAFVVRDIVDLILAGFFLIILVGPLFLWLLVRPRGLLSVQADRIVACALGVGALVTIAGFPFVGVFAVFGGFGIVALVVLAFVRRLEEPGG